MRIDIEAGRLFPVKRTERKKVCPGSLQWERGSDDIYDVTGSANLFQSCWRNESGHIIACPVRSALIKYILDQSLSPANDGTPGQLLFFWKGGANEKRREISSGQQPSQ